MKAEEVREFTVNEAIIETKYKQCPVCEKEFQFGDPIILHPIQQPREGFASVMTIPIHVKCYWVEKND